MKRNENNAEFGDDKEWFTFLLFLPEGVRRAVSQATAA
jgi:hypothetical protein